MNKKIMDFNLPKAIVWHRFSRRAYSTFLSLHRVISVGVLSVSTIAAADLKAQTVISPVTIEKDTATVSYELGDVMITGERVPMSAKLMPRVVSVLSRGDIENAAVQSVNDLLEYAASVDVRQRGEMGVQTDISVRGGTFAQVTILLNGVNISSPYSGHMSADFPVSLDEVERVEILEGPASRIFGTSAFNGAINVVTKCDTASHVAANIFGGSYGLAGGEFSGNFTRRNVHQQLSGSFRRADGDQENSNFEQTKFFYQGAFASPALDLTWQTGVSKQEFGANTFYSAAYPNQWESTTNWLTAVRAETKGVLHFTPAIYWNRLKDHFQLVKDSHFGENFHRTDVYGLNLNGYVSYAIGKTAFGAEMRSENIISTNTGLPTSDSIPVRGEDGIYYTKKDNRDNISYYAEQDFITDRWTISLGAMAYRVTNSNDKMRVYPGVDVAFRPTEKWKITASWNMANRLPTFIDLYYKSPTNEGNVNLQPEETNAVDLSARYRRQGIDAQATIFYQYGKNMLDWVMYTPDDINHAAGFELDNMGFEYNMSILPREIFGNNFAIRKFSVGYAYIHQKRHDDVEIYKSTYALEYLRNKVTICLDTRLVSNLTANINFRYQEREGSYIKYDDEHKSTGELVDYEPYAIVDARLAWSQPRWSIYASANNLFNVSYYDLGNIPQPGIWLKVGIKAKLSFRD